MSQASSLLRNLAATKSAGEANSTELVIDNHLRTIAIPKTITNLGVQYDDEVLQLKFRMPRYLNDTDLSEFTIRINYLNANGEDGVYTVVGPTIGSDSITFTWLVGPTATAYRGNTKFNVCLRTYDREGVIQREYNTTVATLPVLEGLKCSEAVVHQYSDIVQQWEDRLSIAELNRIDATVAMKGDNLYFDPSTSTLYLTSNGEIIGDGVVVAGGGIGPGGGSSNNAVLTLQNKTGWTYKSISQSSSCKLIFSWSSLEDGVSTGVGTVVVKVGGVMRHSATVHQGDVEVDVASHLSMGSNSVRVSISDVYGNSRTIAYTVNVISLTIASTFDSSVAYPGAIPFTYTPTGAVEKTVRFILDGVEIGHSVTSASGRQQSFTIPAQTHGSHTLLVYFDAEIDGETIPSNGLFYDIICTEEGKTDPIISSPFRNVEAEQYITFAIPYRVYVPNSLTANITLWANGVQINDELTVDRTQHTWTYRHDEAGELTLQIKCVGNDGKTVIKEFKMDVTETQIKVEAETEALALHLSSHGRSNNEANPGIWEDRGISAEFSNFNFVSDGWKQDEDGINVLRVAGDARLTIPYMMFGSDFRTTGKTLEFELATRDVLNYNTEVISCYSGDRGYKITAQQLRLASAQSEIGTRYKEDEHIRVTFTIEKKSENRLILCYINGIMSGAVQYPEDDDFSQATPVGITIGSSDCTTDLYNIRVYDNNLTRHQVLDNWIADTQRAQDKQSRYSRNDVYDEYGQIVISKLPIDLCYMVIQAAELPQFKGDEKTCNGYFVDPQNSDRDFTWTNAKIDVQGTSSQYYYRKNYKLKYKNGFVLSDNTNVDTYQMNEDSVPTDTFTMKADVASSEGAFNVILSMLYNEICPYKTPAQEDDPKIRQTIEGFPMVIFWDNGSEVSFLGKYNFNNDKGTEEVFGFQEGDESWETLQNGTERVGWHSADFSGDGWKTDFEARYPDKNTNTTRLQALAEWLVSTDTDQATGNAITPVTYDGVEYTADTEEYRLAKFSAELSDHFIEEAVIFYYLFTEIFLSIDQREKNAFPTYLKDEDRWIVLFYDADSSCGTDNKGNMTFDYHLEDIDYTEAGDPVYNGQNSVLWRNLRETRYEQIAEMYRELRTSNKISYESTIGKFEAHQSKWPEAIFNEDMQIKCLDPLILDGDGLYIPMLQGKKEQWMKWWLYNRFRYLDSKYVTGTSMTNRITIRAHQKANVFLKSYLNMYGHVYFNAAVAEHRMTQGEEYEFEWPASGAEDPVIGINDADLLTSLGDLSPLMVELIDVSGAPHISVLKIGDGAEDYTNYSLKTITTGNNKLLRYIDLRNCPNLVSAPDVSGCINVEEILCEGSGITGIKLPTGGILKKLHLPETVVNLTVTNQPQLTDFSIPSYSQITTLRLENAGVLDGMALDILNAMPENSRVRILGVNIPESTVEEAMAFCDRLDTMRGLDENGNNVDVAQISGTIYIPSLTGEELYRFQSRYPNIQVRYDNITLYTVRFFNGTTLMQTVNNAMYGSSVEYSGDRPIKPGETDESNFEFIGWNPEPTFITGDLDCYAQFKFTGIYSRELVQRTIEGIYENDRVDSVGDYAFASASKLTSVSMPNVTSVGNYAFNGASGLVTIDIPNIETVGNYAFTSIPAITRLDSDKITSIGNWAYNKCANLEYVNLPNATLVGEYAFAGCPALTEAIIPKVEMVFNFCFEGSAALRKVVCYSATRLINYCFRNCTGLEIVDCAPTTALTSGNFATTTKLSHLILRNTSVHNPSDDCLKTTRIASGNGYIYVPRNLIDSYKVATNWVTYANQFRALEDYTVDGTVTGEFDETKI